MRVLGAHNIVSCELQLHILVDTVGILFHFHSILCTLHALSVSLFFRGAYTWIFGKSGVFVSALTCMQRAYLDHTSGHMVKSVKMRGMKRVNLRKAPIH